MDILKSIILGIIEGITEWLPISSTGHLILAESIIPFNNVSENFPQMYNYVIQLGAIIAVVVLFWNKLWPFKMPDKDANVLAVDKGIFKSKQWILWFKVLIATIPSALCFFIDDKIDSIMYYEESGSPKRIGIIVISVMLVVYGILFIVIERLKKSKEPLVKDVESITYKMALLIGAFQMLAVIPGTSRSGATILGALIIGVARPAAAEFSFFLAIPTMVGVSALKILKFLLESQFSPSEFIILAMGMLVSFLISMVCIKKLMAYVRKHDFSVFGWYRIVLGIVVLLYFLVIA